jgi:hypothetical protein
MKAGLFCLMTVGEKPSNQMNDKVGRAAMARVLNLRDIFELVNDRFNDGTFAYEKLIRKVHKMVFPVFAQASDEMQSLLKEQLGQGGRNVAAIPNQLASQSFDHARDRFAVIDIAWRETAREQLALIVDRQVQFEAIAGAVCPRRFDWL